MVSALPNLSLNLRTGRDLFMAGDKRARGTLIMKSFNISLILCLLICPLQTVHVAFPVVGEGGTNRSLQWNSRKRQLNIS